MNDFISTTQAAKILGISRIQVFRKIKDGKIPATKVGRNYLIDRKVLNKETPLTDKDKTDLDASIDRVIDEYGETLKLLKDA